MLLSNTKERAINSDRGGQEVRMTLKQGMKYKHFTRQKREKRNSGQKEQHEPRPGKRQGKLRGRELTWQRCLPVQGKRMGKGKQTNALPGYPWTQQGGGLCHVRPEWQARVLKWSECAGQA